VVAETPLLERLTASDLFLLLWDDYGWSTDIGGLAILDGTSLLGPDGRVRIEAVREHLEPRLLLIPRFRQLLYRPRLGLGWPLWVDAPTFDLASHIRVQPLAAPGSETQLLQACQELARRRLDPDRPLWELWLLPGLPDQRVGAYLRLHHAVADGAAALAAFGALLDPALSAHDPVEPPWTPAPIPTTSELLRDNLRGAGRRYAARAWALRIPAGRCARRDRPCRRGRKSSPNTPLLTRASTTQSAPPRASTRPARRRAPVSSGSSLASAPGTGIFHGSGR
jgi:diacylglycerol O-acyltransferase / wax synthase